jgi:predicted GIY-YIG superfamily endonuclease
MSSLSGKIYKLNCSDNRYYIGYTKKSLEERLKKHISKSREAREKGRKLYRHINSIGWENVTIELLHNISGKNKSELLALESKIIEESFLDPMNLNSGRSFISI